MDESTDTDSSDSDSDSNINNTNVKRGKRSGPSILNEGIIAGQRIAKISVITLISIGIAELIVGYMNGSVVATADGMTLCHMQ